MVILDNYGYPPVVDNPPEQVDGKAPTVFYCIQEDLNATLVNETLNAEGFGTCNISGQLVTCPVEIECQTSEADNCCEGNNNQLERKNFPPISIFQISSRRTRHTLLLWWTHTRRICCTIRWL